MVPLFPPYRSPKIAGVPAITMALLLHTVSISKAHTAQDDTTQAATVARTLAGKSKVPWAAGWRPCPLCSLKRKKKTIAPAPLWRLLSRLFLNSSWVCFCPSRFHFHFSPDDSQRKATDQMLNCHRLSKESPGWGGYWESRGTRYAADTLYTSAPIPAQVTPYSVKGKPSLRSPILYP